ncbi:hypothetical protein BAAM0483_01930 [Bifidobacterium animalis subsp. animalis MCC 0483]|uniref:Type I restriction modification DNA specificity domain-containing protein n=1 Tax=Bifidobacterium animalis subsp. animalis MCC 0483 TaxID=1365955 RepID=A0AB34TAI1_9BIFI|nr:restriction endonuclease subunit S [Bifidobacterium animalis]KOA51046.1 hypothetical protein BAAM0483_01930 [Bifidobacterium animalis subsp. animalis MCC 0483]
MMSAKNLRDSILQMAVEGKLVEQREEEGTAADLLASIREQRAQLVREKKAKPVKGGESVIWRDDDGHWFERRGKGKAVCIDDEIPFDIPDSWCWARMKDVLTFVNGRAYKKAELLSDGKYPVLRVGNLFTNSEWYYSNLELPPEKYCHNGDLLYAWSASFGPTIWQGETCIFHYHIWNIRYSDSLLRRYLFWYLTEDVNRVKKYTTGSAMIHVSMEHMNPRLIPIPPFEEQCRIVSKIDELMPLVDEYGELQQKREYLDRELPIKLRKSILQAAVEGKLAEQSDDDEPASLLLAGIREKRAQLVREGKAKPVKGGESIIYRDDAGHWFERRGKSDPVCIDEEIPFDIPDSWCWARLNGLATLTRGSGIKRSEVREEGLPCVRYGELYTTYGTEIRTPHSFVGRDVFNAAKKLGPDDIVLTLTGENDIDIGRAVINQTGEALAFGGDLLAIADTSVNKNYLLIALHSPAVGKQRTQAATGNIIVHLSAKKVGRFLIPIPPLREQMNICEIIEKVFR